MRWALLLIPLLLVSGRIRQPQAMIWVRDGGEVYINGVYLGFLEPSDCVTGDLILLDQVTVDGESAIWLEKLPPCERTFTLSEVAGW